MLNETQLNLVGYSFVMNLLQTCSPFGEELVRKPHFYSLCEYDELIDEFSRIQTLYELLKDNPSAYRKTERVLMQFKNIKKSIGKLKNTTLSDVDFFEVKRFLILLEKLDEAYKLLCASCTPKGISIKTYPGALGIVDPDGMRVMTFRVSDRLSPKLAAIREQRHKLEIEIKKSGKEMFDSLNAQMTILAAKEEEEEFLVRKDMSLHMAPFADELLKTIDSIAKLDYDMAKARLMHDGKCVIPEFLPQNHQINFGGMINPMIEDALAKRDTEFKSINVTLCPGSTVLTGANMGGKSVTVKTIALNCQLAMTGLPVYADTASLPMLTDIDLLSEDKEDSISGLSSFGGEMLALNDIIAKHTDGCSLVLLDEFARGTNPCEGAALVRAAVKFFSKQSNVFAFITTHFDDVACCADRHYQVMGLRHCNIERLKEALMTSSKTKTDVLEKFMDYGIFELSKNENPPRDALTICHALGISADFIGLTEI